MHLHEEHAHAAARHGLHEHDERIDERDAGERPRAEPADEDRVHGGHDGLEHHDEDVGRGQPEQRWGDRGLQEPLRAGRDEKGLGDGGHDL